MNTFSNSLFTFLFSWTRTLIESVWNAAAEGKYSGFFTWLGDHWLGLVILMCLGGTAVDFLIWMIRWRPYLVWRSHLHKWLRLLRGERVDSQRRFNKGYRDAVDLELAQPEEPAAAWNQQEAEYPGFPEETPPPAPVLPEEFLPPPPENRQPYVYFPPEGTVWQEEISNPGEAEGLSPLDTPEERRRRRSDKHGQTTRRIAWRPRISVPDDPGEEGMLDGLPPAVDKEQAFHEPVYPTFPFSAWRGQGGQTSNGKNV